MDAHDNEALYDALAAKPPPGTGMADRVRVQALSLRAHDRFRTGDGTPVPGRSAPESGYPGRGWRSGRDLSRFDPAVSGPVSCQFVACIVLPSQVVPLAARAVGAAHPFR